MKTFTVSQTVTAEQISGALCSAFEGGSNYWYCIEERVEPTAWQFDSDPKRDSGHWSQDYPLNPGGALLISDSLDEYHGTMRLDLETVQKGLTILAENFSWHFADLVGDNADANTGDAFLQCCLFGDILYG